MIDIIPKEKPSTPGWLKTLFYASLVLLIFSFAIYFFLNQNLKNYEQEFADLSQSLQQQEIGEMNSLEKLLLGYQKKIGDFSILIDKHLKNSNIFGFIQSLSHPKVWFKQFSLNPREASLLISGSAQNFEVLGQQYFILQQERKIKDVILNNVSLSSEGDVSFSFSITLNPNVIK